MLLLMAGHVAAQEISIPNSHLRMTLPTGEWEYLSTINIDDKTTAYLYVYTQQVVTDTLGDTNLPFLRLLVKKDYRGSAYELAYERFMEQPFQSLNEYTQGLPSDGIGYVGAYRNRKMSRDYQFRMIYFKDRNTAFEVRLECEASLYHQFDQYFDDILHTIKIVK